VNDLVCLESQLSTGNLFYLKGHDPQWRLCMCCSPLHRPSNWFEVWCCGGILGSILLLLLCDGLDLLNAEGQ
jgi:hypothetical protein